MSNAVGLDDDQILVVAESRINSVVISEIVKRCGLRAVQQSIAGARLALKTHRPRLVVVDGGADDRDFRLMIDELAALRRSGGRRLPRVILLSNSTDVPDASTFASVVDEIVAKPITPERLQPAIERLARPGL